MNQNTQKVIPARYDVPRGTYEKLLTFEILLCKWNTTINLVGNTQTIWERHILDSLQLSEYLPLKGVLADIGSGAGFPGLILAMLRGPQDAPDVHLIESDARKCQFLLEAARLTDTPVTIHNARAETVSLKNVVAITSRACASLQELLSLSERWLQADTICVFPKGQSGMAEVEAARETWQFTLAEKPSCTEENSVIYLLSEIIKNEHRD